MTDLLPIGIHFGLPDDAHHADPALGSTSIKAIRANAVDWQFDKLFGEEKDPSKALVWGSAFHARTLEGAAAFDARFRTAPDLADYPQMPKVLVTSVDLKEHLAANGVSAKGATRKDQFIELIRQFDRKVLIWDEIKGTFDAEVAAGKVTAIDSRTRKQIDLAVDWLQSHSKTGPVMRNGTFISGAPEVTMIYEYRGVRLKARYDYLYPTLSIDLKSYRPRVGGSNMAAIKAAIERQGYDIQSAAYHRAFNALKELFEAGQLEVFGEPPTADFVQRLFTTPEDQFKWLWVMVKASSAPQITIVEFPKNLLVFEAADRDVEMAIDAFVNLRDKFGPDKAWRPEEEVYILSDEDFRPSFGVYR